VRIAAAESGDRPQRAAQLLGVFDAASGVTHSSAQRLVLDRYLSELPSRLGEAYDTCHERGRQLVAHLGLPGALAEVAETLSSSSP